MQNVKNNSLFNPCTMFGKASHSGYQKESHFSMLV